ncbi:MAG: hypothetical protein AUG44_08730 [Actinobacteria bacterium 13_1_20CM_3_71_11]|nr:MAG: hypothetical protein AUG44_08730 [Actinobacteria bacterium 13_1_20CM_3_71_11]
MLWGVDVSDYQGNFDMARARSEGFDFVFIKATEGATWKAKYFAANLAAARSAGLLVAAYHYQRTDSAASQVANIMSVVPRDVPVILDVESGAGDVGVTRDIIGRLRAGGYKVPLSYIPKWYWQQIGSPSLAGLPPLWQSHYPDNNGGFASQIYGRVPDSYWTGFGGLNIEVLQFTSSATVAGRSPIDANAYRGTLSDLAALLGYAAPTPLATQRTREDLHMLLPTGENMHMPIPASGLPPYLYIACSYGDTVDVHAIDFIGETKQDGSADFKAGGFNDGSLNGATFTGKNERTWTFQSDKPGGRWSTKIPDGVINVSLRYSTTSKSAVAWVG